MLIDRFIKEIFPQDHRILQVQSTSVSILGAGADYDKIINELEKWGEKEDEEEKYRVKLAKRGWIKPFTASRVLVQ